MGTVHRSSSIMPAGVLLAGGLLALLATTLLSCGAHAQGASPGVLVAQSGLEALQHELTVQIERRDYPAALGVVERIRALGQPIPASVVYAEGFALLAVGRAQDAQWRLAEHLRQAGPGSQYYDQLARLHGAAQREVDRAQATARAVPQVSPGATPVTRSESLESGLVQPSTEPTGRDPGLPSFENWPADQPRPHDPELLKRQAPEIATEWELRTRPDAREWMRIRYSRDPEAFRAFLANHPDSRFVEPAKKRYDSVLAGLARRGYEAFRQRDYEAARALFQSAAEQGDDYSQTMLGLLYDRGLGVPEDPEEAFRWYSMAAEKGNATAETNLGVLYYDGRGVPQDSRQALDWLTRAANRGETEALFRIGVVYQYGKGNVPQDLEQARNWFRQAAEQGSEQARQELTILGG